MDVVLLERVAKLGQMGETVNVRPGFARNFLLPQGKAIRANKDNIARFEQDRAKLEAQNLKRREEAERVAERVQVLVVTHLPQVAAYADTHLHVSKDVGDEAVTSGVAVLDNEARIEELARMMAGMDDSDTGRAHAAELFARAQSEIEQLRG